MTVSSQIEMLNLPDTWMTLHKQCGDMLWFSSVVFHMRIHGYLRHPLGELFSSIKLQNHLRSENVTVYINIGPSSE